MATEDKAKKSEDMAKKCLNHANILNLRIQDLEAKQAEIQAKYGDKTFLPGPELLELRRLRIERDWHEAYAERLMRGE